MPASHWQVRLLEVVKAQGLFWWVVLVRGLKEDGQERGTYTPVPDLDLAIGRTSRVAAEKGRVA